MSKKKKMFLKVLYYFFTFSIGILVAVVLPNTLIYEYVAGAMQDNLDNRNFSTSMSLVGGYFDEDYSYQIDFDEKSGLVMFKSATLIENEDEGATQGYKMRLTYSGFLYGVEDYPIHIDGENKTCLNVLDGTKEKKIELLNYDKDNDGKYDSINTLAQFTYVYFVIPMEEFESVNGLTFLDREGNVFKEVNDINLNFDDLFFSSLTNFVEEFNKNNGSERLITLENEFLSVDQSFKRCSFESLQNKAQKDSAIVVLIYFVWIYMLGDFLVGKRYILRFFKWVYYKIRRKPVAEEEKDTSSVYGTDYYCKFTMKLIVPENCDINAVITYSNENNKVEFIFTKDNEYTVVQRVKAGEYVNAWLECPGYETINLPKTLNVRGYKMLVEVTLQEAEEDSVEKKVNMEEDNHED